MAIGLNAELGRGMAMGSKASIRSVEVGSYRKLPHYAVVGDAQAFYLWVNEDGYGNNSAWIIGRNAFSAYHKLRKLQEKDKSAFIAEVKRMYIAHA